MFKVILLAFIAVCTVGNAYIIMGNCGEGIRWYLDTDKYDLIVNGSGKMTGRCDYIRYHELRELVHYITIGGDVETIAEYALIDNPNVWRVFISDKVKVIGERAFAYLDDDYHSVVDSFHLGDSVEEIGEGAFYDLCLDIESLTIPNSVRKIGKAAFSGSCIKSLTIPNSESLDVIDDEAFAHNRLTSLTIPNSIDVIGDKAFAHNRLTSLTIPDSVRKIGGEAFRTNSIESLTIGKSVKMIGDFSFYDNEDLHSVAYLGYKDPCTSDSKVFNVNLTQVCVPLKYKSDTFCKVKVVKDRSPLSKCGITKY